MNTTPEPPKWHLYAATVIGGLIGVSLIVLFVYAFAIFFKSLPKG